MDFLDKLLAHFPERREIYFRGAHVSYAQRPVTTPLLAIPCDRESTEGAAVAIPIPDDVRALLNAPNYVHLATLRADCLPRNWVVCGRAWKRTTS
jgi:hypothetical protein